MLEGRLNWEADKTRDGEGVFGEVDRIGVKLFDDEAESGVEVRVSHASISDPTLTSLHYLQPQLLLFRETKLELYSSMFPRAKKKARVSHFKKNP